MIKRGGRKLNRKLPLVVYSCNAAGLKGKMSSLKSELKANNVAVFAIQETHFSKEGKIQVEGYEIFESIRKKEKGGSVLGIHNALNPTLVSKYENEFELICVEVVVAKREIRIITGYGPQEYWPDTLKLPFFHALEEEVIKAKNDGKDIIIAMDSNSKLGSDVIPNDPHTQSVNGGILNDIVSRSGLIVVNGLPGICKGLITRSRITVSGTEKSVIDHVIISEGLREDIIALEIDETGQKAIGTIGNKKRKSSYSDHNALLTSFNISWSKNNKKHRVELFNLKNKDCQSKFKVVTSENEFLLSAITDNEDINVCIKRFTKRLDTCINKSFRKIRVVDRENKEVSDLFHKRKLLRNKIDETSKKEAIEVDDKLNKLCAEDNYNRIRDVISDIEGDEGGINPANVWKLKNKITSKAADPPTALLDSSGRLVTSEIGREALTLKTFVSRLENRKIRKGLEQTQIDKEKLCSLRLQNARNKKTLPWTIEQLQTVLKSLKKNRSRDPLGYCNEIFSPEVAGSDLQLAILKIMNKIKSDQKFPELLEKCNISSIYKHRGSRNDLENYRGIFRVPILRSILDKLIYNDEYNLIDENLSDSNVGARKSRNIRDNLFVLNAICNSVINGKEEPIDVQIFDVMKCFDALWMEECVNDVFEAGFTNDKLPLIFLTNQRANIAVKMNNKVSKRVEINNVVMQGTVWGSLLCTSSMEKLGKFFYDNDHLLYKYKGKVGVPCLGMIDDLLCVQKCGIESVKANAVINTFVENKKLTLGKSKSHRVHIQPGRKEMKGCAKLQVHEEIMDSTENEKYLGDFVNSKGKIEKTINDRKAKGYAMVAQIMSILEEVPLGRYKVDVGLLLRKVMLMSCMLFNSEVWHSISNKHVNELEKIDEHLLRRILGAHSKTPLEILYLETGSLPIRFIISMRRLLFLQTILKRDDNELTKKIYKTQKEHPLKGDFCELVAGDLS